MAVPGALQLRRPAAFALARLLGRGRVQARAVEELRALREKAGRKASEQTRLWDDTFDLLQEWVLELPPEEQRSEQEIWMSVESWKQKFRDEGKAEGEAKGMARSILSILDHRGIPLSPSQRARVLACTNESTLNTWVLAAGTVSSATALLSSSAVRRPTSRRSVRKTVVHGLLVARDSGSSGRR